MFPPTDIDFPTLVLGVDEQAEETTVEFDGHVLTFAKMYLKFNDHEDTPVILKKFGTKLFALLVREHLSESQWLTLSN